MEKIFAFDIGTTSIGSAVVFYEPAAHSGRIVHLGVRIFPEAREPDGTPLNQARRGKRMARRQLRRRRERRRRLNEALADAGLLPAFRSPEWDRTMMADPVPLRARALSAPLTLSEFGRVIYHLAKQRHYLPPEGDDRVRDETADEKAAATARQSTLAALKASGETLGQHLARRGPRERRRGVHVLRETVLEEFDRLWIAQAAHHPQLRDSALREQIESTVFAQRPVFWRLGTLGRCRFAPGEKLCPKGSWLSQQRRMLEKLNNLAVGPNLRPLDADERAAVLAKLQTQSTLSWGGVRKALKALYKSRGYEIGDRSLRFNLEDGGDKGLFVNQVEIKLAEIFQEGWEGHPHRDAIRHAIQNRLWGADYEQIGQRVVILPESRRQEGRRAVAASLCRDFGLDKTKAAALSDLNLPQGWEPYSIKALEAMLPHLEAGVRFGALVAAPEWEAWRNETFPDRERPTGEVLGRLPSPADADEQKRLAEVRNPTVVRVQNELRKVVNNLIAAYGLPDKIRVELAREVGKSKREREEMQGANRDQDSRRRKAEAELQANGLARPSRDDIQKWLLWKECGERCPYTGDQISFDALFRRGEFQVEHIWPRGRSNDDSYANKILCHRDVNIAKGNKIPFEHFGPDPEAWSALTLRLEKMSGKGGGGTLSRGKVKRFLAREIPEDFASRQLNDTGYAARQAVTSLQRLWPDVPSKGSQVRVQAVTGRVTARLRKEWGLNNILAEDGSKTRADHRHHAIDALVVACAHPGLTQVLSAFWQQKDDPAAVSPRLDAPWPNIRTEAEQHVAGIVVSHRVRKKVSGPLHKETAFGRTNESNTKRGVTFQRYVFRKSLQALSQSEVSGIRDPRVRSEVTSWVETHGGSPKTAFATFPTLGLGGPEIRKARIYFDQQERLMASTDRGCFDPGSNHHIAVYRLADGTIEFDPVSLYRASLRLGKRQPVIERNGPAGSIFLMSLSQGDSLQFAKGERSGIWVVKSLWSNGQIVIESAHDASHGTKTQPQIATIVANARKVAVDPIGRVRPAND